MASSATHKAPSKHSTPPATQTVRISPNWPQSPAMLPGLRKMPEPIVFPTTTAVATAGQSRCRDWLDRAKLTLVASRPKVTCVGARIGRHQRLMRRNR